jgi:hypothetical protein
MAAISPNSSSDALTLRQVKDRRQKRRSRRSTASTTGPNFSGSRFAALATFAILSTVRPETPANAPTFALVVRSFRSTVPLPKLSATGFSSPRFSVGTIRSFAAAAVSAWPKVIGADSPSLRLRLIILK